jgi:hypothetical protein
VSASSLRPQVPSIIAYWTLAVLVSEGWKPSISAQETRSTAQETSGATQLIIEVEPVDTPRLVTREVEIKVRVVATDKNAGELRDLSWRIPENVRGTRFPPSAEPEPADVSLVPTANPSSTALTSASEAPNKMNPRLSWAEGWNAEQAPADVPSDITVAPYPYTFRIPSARIDWYGLVRFWKSDPAIVQSSLNLLFFTGGRSKIVLTAHAAKDARKDAKLYPSEKFVEIEFLPSPTALVIGGIFGVFLLALFERLMSLSARLAEGRWPQTAGGSLDWTQLFRSARFWLSTQFLTGTIQLLLGSCAVIIFLLCVGLWQERDLPVNFKVNGFVAAVFVGLSMHLVVAKLYVRFIEPRVRAQTKTSPNGQIVPGHAPETGRTIG